MEGSSAANGQLFSGLVSNMAAFVRARQTPVNICSYLVHQQRISFGSGRTFSKSPNNAKPSPLPASFYDNT